MKYLTNAPYDWKTKSHKDATIIILETDQLWEEAYKNWLGMKNPTDSPGVEKRSLLWARLEVK